MNKCISAAFMIALASAGAALADSGAPAATLKSAPAPHNQYLYRTTTIIGTDVHDPQDRKIGSVKDLILGSTRGDIAYAVVTFGGVLGVGSKYHAIPWQALQPSDDGSYYVLHADRETISQAPGFDRGKWPDLAERTWSAEVDRYWSRMVGKGAADSNRLAPGVSGANNGSSASGGGNAGRSGSGK